MKKNHLIFFCRQLSQNLVALIVLIINVGLNRGTLLSINNYEDLILHGGKVDDFSPGIWRFKSRSQSWMQLATLIKPRVEHATFPAPGLECP